MPETYIIVKNTRGSGAKRKYVPRNNSKYIRPQFKKPRYKGVKRGSNKRLRSTRYITVNHHQYLNTSGGPSQGTYCHQFPGHFTTFNEQQQINENALRLHCEPSTTRPQNMAGIQNQQLSSFSTINLTDVKEDVSEIKSERSDNNETINENKETKILSFIRVGIKHKQPMTVKQMVMVRRSILRYMSKFAEIASPGTGPRFCSCCFKGGNVLITCQDERSKIWLEECIKGVKPWPDADLSVLPANELPQMWDASALIPTTEAETLEDILLLLKSQNNLKVENWKVRRHNILYNKHYLYLSLDELGVLGLKRLNFRPIVGFKKVPFWIRGVNVSIILDK